MEDFKAANKLLDGIDFSGGGRSRVLGGAPTLARFW